jgi:hypothetical protein
MDALEDVELSTLQINLLTLRAAGKTYREIESELPVKLHPDLIRTCLLRSAKGLYWDIGQTAGPDPYLCEVDEAELCDFLEDASNDRRPRTGTEAADEAMELKRNRIVSGIRLLKFFGCPELAEHLSTEGLLPPSRKWISRFAERKGMNLKARRPIDIQRLDACGKDAIAEFFANYDSLIHR